jgi:hypothetical protein
MDSITGPEVRRRSSGDQNVPPVSQDVLRQEGNPVAEPARVPWHVEMYSRLHGYRVRPRRNNRPGISSSNRSSELTADGRPRVDRSVAIDERLDRDGHLWVEWVRRGGAGADVRRRSTRIQTIRRIVRRTTAAFVPRPEGTSRCSRRSRRTTLALRHIPTQEERLDTWSRD